MKSNVSLFNRFICFVDSISKSKATSHKFIEDINNTIIIALSKDPKIRYEVAEEYGVSVKVLTRWFEEKALKISRGIICPADLRIIYATLGIPKNIKPGLI